MRTFFILLCFLVIGTSAYAKTVEESFVNSTYSNFILSKEGKEVNVLIVIISDQLFYATNERPDNMKHVRIIFNEDGTCRTDDLVKKVACEGNTLTITETEEGLENSISLTFKQNKLFYKSSTVMGDIKQREHRSERDD
jgi:hypothetical protein